MMKMKRMMTLMLAGCLALSLTACGSESTAQSSGSAAASANP